LGGTRREGGDGMRGSGMEMEKKGMDMEV